MATEVATRRVLLVEDEPDVASLIRSVLEEEGYDVLVFTNGDCLGTARSYRPHVVLCDYMLPVYDGQTVCENLRSGLDERVPFIMISAMRHASRNWRGWGVDDFLSKPFDIDRLVGVVNRAVGADARLFSPRNSEERSDEIAS